MIVGRSIQSFEIQLEAVGRCLGGIKRIAEIESISTLSPSVG